jgi:hypothetical protein
MTPSSGFFESRAAYRPSNQPGRQRSPTLVVARRNKGVMDLAKDSQALDAIRTIFGLSESELADLFDVRRESILGWRKKGIPVTRRAGVARVLDVARVLWQTVLPDRIPKIVRTSDEWLPQKTILETIRRDGVDPIYAYLRRLCTYSSQ